MIVLFIKCISSYVQGSKYWFEIHYTPTIKYWPSAARIFKFWTLYNIVLTLWCTILSCTSFFIPQKTCFSRPYCTSLSLKMFVLRPKRKLISCSVGDFVEFSTTYQRKKKCRNFSMLFGIHNLNFIFKKCFLLTNCFISYVCSSFSESIIILLDWLSFETL